MSFNVKSRLADAIVQEVLAKPAGERHGCTGFWKASLRRVLEERHIRIATLEGHRFLMIADIDPEGTHIMQSARLAEYLAHEALKQSKLKQPLSSQASQEIVSKCIAQGRIVVAFKNARPIAEAISSTARNPVWYESEH